MPEVDVLTIKDAAAALRAGTLTSTDLTRRLLDRIGKSNEILGAFVAVCDDTAMKAAAAADSDFAAGVYKGPLQGIPLAVKDIISTQEAPTTANSRVLPADWGGGIDAPVVTRLREAGAVVVGKSTTSEFACGAPDPDKGFLIPRNPWNTEHTAAGSSSGTGIAVAAGLALGGLGTDTGGSVRGPASVNGHTGLKVTFGRVPKAGVVPLGYTLDSIGPMARSAYDCALLLEVMAGYHPDDRFAADVEVPTYSELLTGSVEGVRIGVATPYFFDSPQLDSEVREAVLTAVETLKAAGAIVTEVTVPYAKEAKEANHITMVAEAYAYHRQNLIDKWNDYGRFTRPTLAKGAFFTAGDYVQAQRLRTAFRSGVRKVLSEVDVIVTPSMLTPAERIDEMDMQKRMLGPGFTGQWNLAGLPAVAVPVGFSSTTLPLSMQIVGSPFAEATVLSIADAYQRITDWHLRVPPVEALIGT
jgi:aspartyl-tRNA(Asn)/glutamyl-tRNA(Gln) amidotransferase subunit A